MANNNFKVLHIHTLPIISGSGINTLYSMIGLKKLGYNVELACAPNGKLIDKTHENGIGVNSIDHFRQEISPINDLIATYELYKVIKKKKFQIIHTHNSKAGFLGRLAGLLACCPIIIHTCHGYSFHDEENLLKRYLFILLEQIAAKWTHFIIFISEPLIIWAKKYKIRPKLGQKKIYSGIDLNEFRVDKTGAEVLKTKYGFKKDDFLIGFVSKLWEGKGHEYAIRAMVPLKESLRNAKLVIVGEGYLQNKIENLISELNLSEEVIIWGFTESTSKIMTIFDVAILPSLFEGMGRVILEAMAMRKPVIGTNVGGIPDLIKNGVTGILIPPKDSTAISEAILKVANNREFALKIAEKGYKMAHSSQFTVEHMVTEIASVYEEMILANCSQLQAQD